MLLDNINSSSRQVAEGRVREWTLMSLSQELASLKHIGMCNVRTAPGHNNSKLWCRRRKLPVGGGKSNVQKIEIKWLCCKFTE